MTIPTMRESDEIAKNFWGEVESCHFCRKPTKYWHENTNNPVCRQCAKSHKVAELPDHGQRIRAAKRKLSQALRGK